MAGQKLLLCDLSNEGFHGWLILAKNDPVSPEGAHFGQ
jgi:hypothetical protein